MIKLNPVSAPLSQSMILICEKCGAKDILPNETNLSHTLQLGLKEEIKNTMSKGISKAVLTGCMSICSVNQISVGVIALAGSKSAFYTVERNVTEYDFSEVLQMLAYK